MPLAAERKQAKSLGLTQYWTGRPCKAGHVAFRDVINGTCIECRRERQRSPRRRELGRKHVARYRIRNKDRLLAERRLLRTDHAFRENERAQERKRSRAKWRSDVEWRTKRLARIKIYAQKNPEKIRIIRRNNKSKRKNAIGKHTERDIAKIMKLQKGRCAYCRVKLADEYHIDHITAIACGGSNFPSNLQATCSKCNISKGAKDPIEFAQSLGFML